MRPAITIRLAFENVGDAGMRVPSVGMSSMEELVLGSWDGTRTLSVL